MANTDAFRIDTGQAAQYRPARRLLLAWLELHHIANDIMQW